MTMRSTAPKTASSEHARPPADVGEDEADLAPRHHPDADGEPAERHPRRGPAGDDLADDREHDEHRAGSSRRRAGRRGSSSRGSRDAPTPTKKIGAKMDATGLTSRSMVSNWLVPDRIRPAAKAPMMSADRPASASPARPSANATANDQQDVAHPHAHDRRRTAAARRTGRPARRPRGSRPRPPSIAERRPARSRPRRRRCPLTTLRITSPSTSSMTAAPRMIRASGVRIRPESDSTRAVIPTEVAVSVAPTKIAGGETVAAAARGMRRVRPVADSPRANGSATPTAATDERGRADPEHLAQIGLEPDLEQQQHDAQLGSTWITSAAAPSAGTMPSTLRPSSTPATSSPSTAGCPIRSASSPRSLAADQDGGERQEEAGDVDAPPRPSGRGRRKRSAVGVR